MSFTKSNADFQVLQKKTMHLSAVQLEPISKCVLNLHCSQRANLKKCVILMGFKKENIFLFKRKSLHHDDKINHQNVSFLGEMLSHVIGPSKDKIYI